MYMSCVPLLLSLLQTLPGLLVASQPLLKVTTVTESNEHVTTGAPPFPPLSTGTATTPSSKSLSLKISTSHLKRPRVSPSLDSRSGTASPADSMLSSLHSDEGPSPHPPKHKRHKGEHKHKKKHKRKEHKRSRHKHSADD